MKQLLFLLLFVPTILFAQEKTDKKYLAGAVPVVDGMVTFTKVIEAPGLTRDQIYEKLSQWAEKRFVADKELESRVLYMDPQGGTIVCQGQEYLIFADKLLALDRAVITYQVSLTSFSGNCYMKISSIIYSYNTGRTNGMELLRAESTITDEHTLTKKRDKLIRATGKFRIHTIDLVDRMYDDIVKVLGGNVGETKTNANTPLKAVAPVEIAREMAADMTHSSSQLEGYKQIAPDKIPGNIIKMLSEGWSLITAGNDEKFNMMTASWGGLGYLYNKPVAFSFIYPTRYTYQLMEKGDTYTISFFTETYREVLEYCGNHSGKDADKVKESGLTPITTPSGSKAFSEAWMIIECRKMISQSITPEAIFDEQLKEKWAGKQLHKVYIGEIVNVWVK